MNFEELQAMDREYIAPTYARFPLGIVKGQGAVCTDTEGRDYLDFTSGIGVNSLGFCDPEWVEAVSRQAGTIAHMSNLYYTQPDALVAQKLCARTGCKKVFFANSGAEANEGVIKAARKWSHDKYGEGRDEIVTLVNSFHGRTIATLSATGQEVFHKDFGPFTPGFVHARANDAGDLRARINERTCAIMVECIQGEGGVIPLDQSFADAVRELCREHDLLLIVDEVQTGVGRTGSFLACQQLGLSPDLVSLAKGLGGGLPLGAVLLYEKCEHTFGPGDHATTFGGNPIACAGANVVLDRMDDAFLAEVRRKSETVFHRAAAMPHVKSVTGMGLMIGVEFEDGIQGRDVVNACIPRGAIFLTAKAKLRMLPPLVITDRQLERGLDILESVLNEWEVTAR